MDPSEASTEIKDSLSWVLLVKRNKKKSVSIQPTCKWAPFLCATNRSALLIIFRFSGSKSCENKIDGPFTDSYKGLPWEYQYNFNPNWSVSKKPFEFF